MNRDSIAHRSRKGVVVMTFAAALAVILLLAWYAYHPGLYGAFLFDDLGSLPKLGATGPVDNWATFWRYITSGSADPAGRPLALLTFLIDGHDWPANPYPFKVTNVILHLINGALLAWVLWKLGCVLTRQFPGSSFRTPRSGDPESRFSDPKASGAALRTHSGIMADQWTVAIAALFGAGTWLLHPLFVSTTLYVVQREAMLPATFVLIAIVGWIASREALALGHVRRALAGMALSAWLCTLLAVLSKANGALLPLLLLLVEWTILSRQPIANPRTRVWQHRATAVFLILPTVLVAGYLLTLFPWTSLGRPVDARGWSVAQRLLTEPRVLTDYLRLLFVPHAHSSGLFNDAFPLSTGWLHPASTLPCILLILGLVAGGFALRKRHPAIALALLFYFAAQLMESGWIPLELYFEHRNYLPAMLLFWPIGLALGRPGRWRLLAVFLAVAFLVGLAKLTSQRAELWGNAFHQAQMWAAINPDSARAQTSAALYDLQNDRPRLAVARLRLALPRHPDDLQIPVNLITAECRLGAVRPDTLAAARIALAGDRAGGNVAFNWFNEALSSVKTRACDGLGYRDLQRLLDAANRNPWWRKHPGLRQNLLHLQGMLDLAQRKPRDTLRDFDMALKADPDPGSALSQAATLGAAGYPELGLAHLDYASTLPPMQKSGFTMARLHAWVLQRQGWWRKETADLRKTLTTDAAAKAALPGKE